MRPEDRPAVPWCGRIPDGGTAQRDVGGGVAVDDRCRRLQAQRLLDDGAQQPPVRAHRPGEVLVPQEVQQSNTTGGVGGLSELVVASEEWGLPIWSDLPGDVTSGGTTAAKTDSMLSEAQRSYQVLLLP